MDLMPIKIFTARKGKKTTQTKPKNSSYFSVLEASFFIFYLWDKMQSHKLLESIKEEQDCVVQSLKGILVYVREAAYSFSPRQIFVT